MASETNTKHVIARTKTEAKAASPSKQQMEDLMKQLEDWLAVDEQSHAKQALEVPPAVSWFLRRFKVYGVFKDAESDSTFVAQLSVLAKPVIALAQLDGTKRQAIAFRLLHLLTRSDDFYRDCQAGLLGIVVRALQNNAGNGELVCSGLKAMGNILYQESSNIQEHMRLEPLIRRLLTRYQNDPVVAEPCVWSVSNIFYANAPIFPIEIFELLLTLLTRFDTTLSLLCEICYSLFNLMHQAKFPVEAALMIIRSKALMTLANLLVKFRTTQFFVPALDVIDAIARLLDTHSPRLHLEKQHRDELGQQLIAALPKIYSIMMPGYVVHEFKASCSFEPRQDDIENCLVTISRLVFNHIGQDRRPNHFRHFTALLIPPLQSVASLQKMALCTVARHNPEQLKEHEPFCSDAKQLMKCGHCGIPVIPETSPALFLHVDSCDERYFVFCSSDCQQDMSIPEEW